MHNFGEGLQVHHSVQHDDLIRILIATPLVPDFNDLEVSCIATIIDGDSSLALLSILLLNLDCGYLVVL